MLVSATDAVDALLPRLHEIAGYRPMNVGGYAVHAFGDHDDDEQIFGYVHSVRDSRERVLVLAHQRDRLVRGIEILEGRTPNLGQASNPVDATYCPVCSGNHPS